MSEENKEATEPAGETSPENEETNGGKGEETKQGGVTFGSEKELQDYIDTALKERLSREEKKREEAERKAREEAEQKALEDNQEYKELAEKRQETIVGKDATLQERDDRIAELEGQVEAMKPYQDMAAKRVEAMLEEVPESVKELLADREPIQQLEWLEKNPKLSHKALGMPHTPKPEENGKKELDQQERERVAHKPRL